MVNDKDYCDLGEIIVKKLRDENFKHFLNSLTYSKSISLEEYNKIPKNNNILEEFRKNTDNNFKFLNSLDGFQTEELKKLILRVLDNTAFNFLREIEENYIDDRSIGLSFRGNDIKEIYDKFLSGTFFGEYFLWLEKFSSYGKFQH